MKEPFMFGLYRALYADLKTLLKWVKSRFRER